MHFTLLNIFQFFEFFLCIFTLLQIIHNLFPLFLTPQLSDIFRFIKNFLHAIRFKVSFVGYVSLLAKHWVSIYCRDFHRFFRGYSAGMGVGWNLLPSGTTCLSTSHLRRHSRFSDNDSRPFCFPVPTKTLSYDSCFTIHHYCLDTRGPCNN